MLYLALSNKVAEEWNSNSLILQTDFQINHAFVNDLQGLSCLLALWLLQVPRSLCLCLTFAEGEMALLSQYCWGYCIPLLYCQVCWWEFFVEQKHPTLIPNDHVEQFVHAPSRFSSAVSRVCVGSNGNTVLDCVRCNGGASGPVK